MQLGQAGMADLAGKQARRDYPGDPAAVTESGVGQLTHEPDAASAVDQIDAPAGEQRPEGTGRIPVAGISRCRRPTEHADRAESHHERNLSDRRRPASMPAAPAATRHRFCGDTAPVKHVRLGAGH